MAPIGYRAGQRLHDAPEAKVWRAMKRRCYDSNHWNYQYYGARGITVCDEWLNNPWSFIDWLRAEGWEHGMKLDREKNDLGYSPDNCRLTDHTGQVRNMRNAFLLTIDGVTRHAKEWEEISGTKYYTIKSRVRQYGWSAKEAVFGRAA